LILTIFEFRKIAQKAYLNLNGKGIFLIYTSEVSGACGGWDGWFEEG